MTLSWGGLSPQPQERSTWRCPVTPSWGNLGRQSWERQARCLADTQQMPMGGLWASAKQTHLETLADVHFLRQVLSHSVKPKSQ